MSEAVYHEQYKDKWRERLFYQYKLYVDSISRLHAREHIILTIFILINGFLVVSMLVALGAEAIMHLPWLDTMYEFLGVISCVAYYFYIWHIHRRNMQMMNAVRQIERDLPASLLVMTSPTSIVVRVVQDMVPLFFIAAYLYMFLSMHVFSRSLV